jgi:hypothetical protein
MPNDRSLKNLRPPWKPGDPSPNPSGRAKKRPITDRYHEGLEAPLEENIRLALGLPEGATNGDTVAKAQIRAAIKGKTYAARELREAIEGKSTQRLEIIGEDGGAIKVDIAESLARIREFYGLANASVRNFLNDFGVTRAARTVVVIIGRHLIPIDQIYRPALCPQHHFMWMCACLIGKQENASRSHIVV